MKSKPSRVPALRTQFSLTRAALSTCRAQKQIPIGISNAKDRKGFIADSAGSFVARRIGKREFLRRLGLAGVGLSSFAATMLGGNRRFPALAAQQALAQTGPAADMTNWLRQVGRKYKGTKIRYVSEATPPTVVAKLLAKDEFTANTGIEVDIEIVPLEQVLQPQGETPCEASSASWGIS